ncbi:MAG: Smr/MutS family protein [Candidatus Doudnabacteria bacterium]|nr:Smr/MutS family protein [Candidatus Doudnabacteria bacterium]
MNKYERVPEKVIDLHGYTTREAKEILDELLGGAFKHVRIITGKGTFRETGPVMRNFVEGYLKRLEIKFETAKLYNGGDGAFEVYF